MAERPGRLGGVPGRPGLKTLEPPAPLVLVPRRQPRKLNASLDFLGEQPTALNVNVLTDSRVIDTPTGMVRYSAIPVTIGPA